MGTMKTARIFLRLGCLALGACTEELYGKLSERDANEMVAELMRHGIPASRADSGEDGYSVRVDQDRFADAVTVLKDAGYPRQNFASMGDLFSGDKLVSSPVEERARLVYGLSQELDRTISQIDGVVSARVHVVLPIDDPLRQQQPPSSAAVFIRHAPDAAVDTLVPQVKMLVAHSIEGLNYDNVTVVLMPVAPASESAAAAADTLTRVAGIWVYKTSATAAAILIYGLLTLAALGCALASYILWQRKPGAIRQALRSVKLPARLQAP